MLLFLSQGGYHVFFSIRQYEAKEEMKHRLLASVPEHLLQVINADVNKEDIEWEEEGREFFLHGQLYDVAYTKTVNGHTLIYCLNDHKEDQLLKKLSAVVAGHADQPGNHPGQHHTRFEPSDFILFTETTFSPKQTTTPVYSDGAERLVSAPADPACPPPNIKSKQQTTFL
ncbi:MAG TPA: hypothetical protein PLZ45_13695 [Ferruginibacter sp.]|nr:hypothetical protein [Ferruginibacter sp.]